MYSFWERNSFIPNPDVLIVGAGIVGLSAALNARKRYPKANIVVLERSSLPTGASTKNAGFACFGSAGEVLDDLQHDTAANVFQLVKARYEGLNLLRSLLGDDTIAYQACGGYELFLPNEAVQYEKCLLKLDFLNTELEKIIGLKQTYSNVTNQKVKFGFGKTLGMLFNQYEGAIDTGKMMHALWLKCLNNGIHVVCGLGVDNVKSIANTIQLNLGNGVMLEAAKVIITTNAFAKQLVPTLNIKPARGQVLITEPIENLPFSGTFHIDKGYYYFRNVGNRVLLGGGRNLDFEGETTYEFGLSIPIQNQLEHYLHSYIVPNLNAKIAMRWSGIMGFGSSKSPTVQKLDSNLLVAVGMGGMGVALGCLVGKQVAELL